MFVIAICEQEIEDNFGSFIMLTTHASTLVVAAEFNVNSVGIWYPILASVILGCVFECVIKVVMLCIRTAGEITSAACAGLATLEVTFWARHRRDVSVPFALMMIFIT